MQDILLVEDHVELAKLIKTFLCKEGFSLYHVTSGEEAIEWLTKHVAKIVLLDIMLPHMDGFAVCKKIRQKGDQPIIIMSAKSEKTDQLLGFELGADDYMEKPVDPDILCAKVKALLMRSQSMQQDDMILQSGAITMDLHAHKVYLYERLLDLNIKEFALLLLFVKNAGKTLHKDYLFKEIWGCDSESENQTLTVHIKMLRSIIEDNPKKPQRIQTVWGVGYRYEEI